MTPKQIQKFQEKIAKVKLTLASEKRKFGYYDDSQGLRYLPTKYFVQIGDYSGGLKYLKWFVKIFPDDVGVPEFLFEWTIILFKNTKLKEAEKKAFQTFCSNPYWFNKYYGRLITQHEMWHSSNLTTPECTETLEYSSDQTNLVGFSEWLGKLITSERFVYLSNKYIDIFKRLDIEKDKEMRHYLVRQAFQLEQGQ